MSVVVLACVLLCKEFVTVTAVCILYISAVIEHRFMVAAALLAAQHLRHDITVAVIADHVDIL